MRSQMTRSAADLGRPLLHYERLCTGDLAAVRKDLERSRFLAGRLDLDAAAAQIIQTRHYHAKGEL
jgi:hypothetical protein